MIVIIKEEVLLVLIKEFKSYKRSLYRLYDSLGGSVRRIAHFSKRWRLSEMPMDIDLDAAAANAAATDREDEFDANLYIDLVYSIVLNWLFDTVTEDMC